MIKIIAIAFLFIAVLGCATTTHGLRLFDEYLNQWALVGVVDKLSKLSIIIVVLTYFIQMPGKRKNERKIKNRMASFWV